MVEQTKTLTFIVNLICILGIIFSIYSVAINVIQRNRYSELQREVIEIQEATASLDEGIYQIQTLTILGVLSSDSEEQTEFERRIVELDESNRKAIDNLEKIYTREDEQEVIKELSDNYSKFMDNQKLASDIAVADNGSTLRVYVNSVMSTYLECMNESIDELRAMLTSRVDRMTESISVAASNSFRISLAFAIAMSITLIYAIYLTNKSSKMINEQFVTQSKTHREQIINMQGKTINDLAELVESRDGNTGTHIKNTAWYVDILSRNMKEMNQYKDILTDDYCERMVQYAPLHDLGKILVSDTILLKPGRLSNDEFNRIKCHAAQGGEIVARILHGIETDENIAIARDIATYHHEKWDGSGYPFGISGEDIPLCARIMAVADVFDALISQRCYKDAFTIEEAYKIIEQSAGSHFDPTIVKVFVNLRPEIEDYLNESVHALSPEVVGALLENEPA